VFSIDRIECGVTPGRAQTNHGCLFLVLVMASSSSSFGLCSCFRLFHSFFNGLKALKMCAHCASIYLGATIRKEN
jgi:hypothetical protein